MATPPFKYAIFQQQGPDRVNAYLLRNNLPPKGVQHCMMHDHLLTSCTHTSVCYAAAGRSPPATARRQNLAPAMVRHCVILHRGASTEGRKGRSRPSVFTCVSSISLLVFHVGMKACRGSRRTGPLIFKLSMQLGGEWLTSRSIHLTSG